MVDCRLSERIGPEGRQNVVYVSSGETEKDEGDHKRGDGEQVGAVAVPELADKRPALVTQARCHPKKAGEGKGATMPPPAKTLPTRMGMRAISWRGRKPKAR